MFTSLLIKSKAKSKKQNKNKKAAEFYMKKWNRELAQQKQRQRYTYNIN